MVSLEICGQGGVQAHSSYVHRNTSRCLVRFTARLKNVHVGETLRKTGPKKGRKERKRSRGKL